MPNPSIAADLLQDELSAQQAIVSDLRNPKGTREAALRRVRTLEAQLGLDETPAINGRPAAHPAPPSHVASPVAAAPLDELYDIRVELTTLQRGIIVNALHEAKRNPLSMESINADRDQLIDMLTDAKAIQLIH